MRRWILYILIIAFAWLVTSRFAEVEKLAGVLVSGRWQWVGVAFVLQIIYHAIYTRLYQSAFATVGVKSRFRDLLPVTFARQEPLYEQRRDRRKKQRADDGQSLEHD